MTYHRAILAALALSALTSCALTPTQQKWAGIAVSVIVTGALVAHEADSGKPISAATDKRIPSAPCATSPQECR